MSIARRTDGPGPPPRRAKNHSIIPAPAQRRPWAAAARCILFCLYAILGRVVLPERIAINPKNPAWTALLLAAVALAGGQVSPPGRPAGADLPVVDYRLRNGLRVLLLEDNGLPLVSVVVAYGAGAVRETPGKTGLAYLLESLMFQGSENVGPMQYIKFVQEVGGDLNAGTTHDRAIYYETVPVNQLARALWLESDRMRSLAFGAGVVERAKEGLLAEHRQRKASEPFLDSTLRFDELLYADFSRGHPAIGIESDIKGLTEEDARGFRDAYYVPNNAILCLAGDFVTARAKELVARYFDSIPKGPDVPPLPPLPVPPASPGGAGYRDVVSDSLASAPAVHVGYRLTTLQTGDPYALRMLEYVLIRGKGSRIYRRLVKRERVALFLTGGIEERAGAYVFKAFATGNNDLMVERCQKAVASEIDRLRTEFISDAELERAKVRLAADYLMRLETTLERALFLTETALARGGLEGLKEDLSRYQRVNAQTLYSLVNRHFSERNGVTLAVRLK